MHKCDKCGQELKTQVKELQGEEIEYVYFGGEGVHEGKQRGCMHITLRNGITIRLDYNGVEIS